MRLLLVLAVLGLASPADAHCFSRWHYKTPQHCNNGVRLAQSQPQPAPAREVIDPHPPAPAPEDHDWFVEIVLPDADPARTQGVEKLKSLLGPE